jgi:threonine dehydrogenase-like Zn-dependent dehydrogenase
MKAVVYHGIGDIRMDDVPEPKIKDRSDATVRLTASAICGTDLHLIRGTVPGMKKGTILGHEGVGVVEEAGRDVHNLKPGDRVVIGSTVACGYCSYCRAGWYSQCDSANPLGKEAGTVFFGLVAGFSHEGDFRWALLAASFLFLPAAVVAMFLHEPGEEPASAPLVAPAEAAPVGQLDA